MFTLGGVHISGAFKLRGFTVFGIKKYPKQNQTGSDKIQIAVTMIVNIYRGIVASIKE